MSNVAKDLKDILKKLRKTKPEINPEIPKGFVRCSRCGTIVKEEKATIDIEATRPRKNIWVCDKCFFGEAR